MIPMTTHWATYDDTINPGNAERLGEEMKMDRTTEQCPSCSRFVKSEADGFYARERREDDTSMVRVFCNEQCANRYHMKREEHTPGLITVRTFPDSYPELVSADGNVICPDVDTNANAEELAHRWNTQPDLLAALELLFNSVESTDWQAEGPPPFGRCARGQIITQARAEITKARR